MQVQLTLGSLNPVRPPILYAGFKLTACWRHLHYGYKAWSPRTVVLQRATSNVYKAWPHQGAPCFGGPTGHPVTDGLRRCPADCLGINSTDNNSRM